MSIGSLASKGWTANYLINLLLGSGSITIYILDKLAQDSIIPANYSYWWNKATLYYQQYGTKSFAAYYAAHLILSDNRSISDAVKLLGYSGQ